MRSDGLRALRIIYFGMPCTFSLAPLEALLNTHHTVVGVVVPGSEPIMGRSAVPVMALEPQPHSSLLPLVNPYLTRTVVQLAWEHAIPVWGIGRPAVPQSVDLVQALRPDIAVVACFSHRIPRKMLDVPSFGFLNIHPSLLPAYRGPAPLFWTFRDGVRATGVTLHQMDEDLDTGPIVRQAPILLPDGASGRQADHLCSTLGGSLLVAAIQDLSPDGLQGYAQQAGATYAPWPQEADFVINTSWSARHAYNFMCGTAEWQHPYSLVCPDDHLVLQRALAYNDDEVLETTVVRLGNEVRIRFNEGVLHAVLAPNVL